MHGEDFAIEVYGKESESNLYPLFYSLLRTFPFLKKILPNTTQLIESMGKKES